MAAGTQAYFAACAKGAMGQIILRDGPAVLGWERWREIDARHFGGKFPRALNAAMDAGLIAAPLTPDRVLDLLLAMRRGIIAEHLGKETHLPLGDDRFRSLIPEALALLKEVWTPPGNDKKQSVNASRLQPVPNGELRRARTTDS